MSITYPQAAPTLDGTLTVKQIHYLMNEPSVIARRVRTRALYRYISDFLLTGRYVVEGGAVLYTAGGEPIFANDDPEVVGIGGEYPLTSIGTGTLAMAKTSKYGRDTKVFDETIKRMRMQPVNRAIEALVNSNVRYIDTAALSVIASKITRTYTAGGAWTSLSSAGEQIVEDVMQCVAQTIELEDGFNLDTVVLKPTQFAKVKARFMAADLTEREGPDNVLRTDVLNSFNYLGLTWVTSVHSPVTDPLLLDRQQLGGMANEDLESPGYVSAGPGSPGVEVLTMRLEKNDGYRVRARRVTVPVVVEPNAGIRITGTGI